MSKEKITLNISGMTCVNCSNGIQRVVNKMEGLDSSKVNFTSNNGEFTIDTEKLDKSKLIAKIKKLGYGVEENMEALETCPKRELQKTKRTLLCSCFF